MFYKKLSLIFTTILTLINYEIRSEIQQVAVQWNPGTCNQGCAALLKNHFLKRKEILEASVSHSSGSAILKWDPKSRFSYHIVKGTMQMVGVGVNEISVKVQGKIRPQGNSLVLSSQGDNTLFTLISPPHPELDRFTPYANPQLLELEPGLKAQMLRLANEGKSFIIEGPLYQPARSPPLYLIIARMSTKDQ